MRFLSFWDTALLPNIIGGQNVFFDVQTSSEEFGHRSLEEALMDFVGMFDAVLTVCMVKPFGAGIIFLILAHPVYQM